MEEGANVNDEGVNANDECASSNSECASRNDDGPQLLTSDVRRKLDFLALRSLELCEDILHERVLLDNEMREAYLDMAKTRYNMGNWTVGTNQLPSQDAEIEALYRVETINYGNVMEFSLLESNSEENVYEEQNLRQRIKSEESKVEAIFGTDDEENMGIEDDDDNGNVKIKIQPKSRKNPLNWFGILVPASLKQSQHGFQKSLHRLCRIATLQNELINVYSEYNQLTKKNIREC